MIRRQDARPPYRISILGEQAAEEAAEVQEEEGDQERIGKEDH